MLGLRTRPSSRALTDALNLLNAVGSDKAKVKILEEIKQAQAKYEAVVELSREAKKAADQSRAEAEKALTEARTAQENASKAYDSFLREKEEALETISAKEADLTAREQSLAVSFKDFKEHENRTHAFYHEKQKVLDQAERTQKLADALLIKANGIMARYWDKTARIKAIVDEE